MCVLSSLFAVPSVFSPPPPLACNSSILGTTPTELGSTSKNNSSHSFIPARDASMSARLGERMQIGIQKLNQAQERLRKPGWELALCKAEERALDELSFGSQPSPEGPPSEGAAVGDGLSAAQREAKEAKRVERLLRARWCCGMMRMPFAVRASGTAFSPARPEAAKLAEMEPLSLEATAATRAKMEAAVISASTRAARCRRNMTDSRLESQPDEEGGDTNCSAMHNKMPLDETQAILSTTQWRIPKGRHTSRHRVIVGIAECVPSHAFGALSK